MNPANENDPVQILSKNMARKQQRRLQVRSISPDRVILCDERKSRMSFIMFEMVDEIERKLTINVTFDALARLFKLPADFPSVFDAAMRQIENIATEIYAEDNITGDELIIEARNIG